MTQMHVLLVVLWEGNVNSDSLDKGVIIYESGQSGLSRWHCCCTLVMIGCFLHCFVMIYGSPSFKVSFLIIVSYYLVVHNTRYICEQLKPNERKKFTLRYKLQSSMNSNIFHKLVGKQRQKHEQLLFQSHSVHVCIWVLGGGIVGTFFLGQRCSEGSPSHNIFKRKVV